MFVDFELIDISVPAPLIIDLSTIPFIFKYLFNSFQAFIALDLF